MEDLLMGDDDDSSSGEEPQEVVPPADDRNARLKELYQEKKAVVAAAPSLTTVPTSASGNPPPPPPPHAAINNHKPTSSHTSTSSSSLHPPPSGIPSRTTTPPAPQTNNYRALSASRFPDPTPVSQLKRIQAPQPQAPAAAVPNRGSGPVGTTTTTQHRIYTTNHNNNNSSHASSQPRMPAPVPRGTTTTSTTTSLASSHRSSVPSTTSHPTTTTTTNHPSKTTTKTTTTYTPEELRKKEKERFLIFTRVLMKYLDNKDPALHAQVKHIIRDCANRNKAGEVGYESVTSAMNRELRRVVPTDYWRRASEYMVKYLESKKGNMSHSQQQQQHRSSSSNNATTTHAPPTSSSSSSRPTPASNMTGIRPTASTTTTAPPLSTTKQTTATTSTTTPKSATAPATQASSHTTTTSSTTTTKSATVTRKAPTTTPTARRVSQAAQQEFWNEIDHAVWVKTLPSVLHTSQPEEELLRLQQQQPKYNTNSTQQNNNNIGESTLSPEFPLHGWGSRNVLSVRAAWARVRCVEEGAVWLNEDHAEEDLTLAAVSEGLQLYLKSVIEKAVYCARQRQNIDGIRLWHQQMVPGPQPLLIRLGCNTERQLARTLTNAAQTAKRMESALKNQNIPKHEQQVNDETMVESSSMSDLALRPPLEKGVEDLEATAKRYLELTEGTLSNECPFGRISKMPRLELVDFQMGMKFSKTSKHRASTAVIRF